MRRSICTWLCVVVFGVAACRRESSEPALPSSDATTGEVGTEPTPTDPDAFQGAAGIEEFLRTAPEFFVVSIDPASRDLGDFGGYRLFGSVRIDDDAQRQQIVSDFYTNLQPPEPRSWGHGAAYCFSPRHGLWAKGPDREVEVLLCFECIRGLVVEQGKEELDLVLMQAVGIDRLEAPLLARNITIDRPELRGSGKRVPLVRHAKPTVDGELDPDLVRRIARAHINEVRTCYNRGLVRDPDLQGRVTVEFVIAASGKVSASALYSYDTTLADAVTATCIVDAVKRWRFPKPKTGTAEVRYPFDLSPS